MMEVQVGKRLIRGHNGMLVNFEGADGMKTGFICNSGYNIVASATRDGRKLVAVVLGEPTAASRRDRASNLLENGFKRYFWKSVFGTSIDGLAVQASLSNSPTHLRDNVCGAGPGRQTLPPPPGLVGPAVEAEPDRPRSGRAHAPHPRQRRRRVTPFSAPFLPRAIPL